MQPFISTLQEYDVWQIPSLHFVAKSLKMFEKQLSHHHVLNVLKQYEMAVSQYYFKAPFLKSMSLLFCSRNYFFTHTKITATIYLINSM